MGRRKRDYLDDDLSDSSGGGDSGEDGDFGANEDPDVRAERERFQDPYARKRRRRNGKEAAIYGDFLEDEEDSRPSGSRGRAGQQVEGYQVSG